MKKFLCLRPVRNGAGILALTVSAAFLLSISAAAQEVDLQKLQPQDSLWVIGHRSGRFEFDENTLQGFKDAYDFGLRGFETDIRLTRDGVLVIMHDNYVSRVMKGTGIVEENDWSYFEPMRSKFGDNPITKFEDLLSFFNSKEGLYVEFELKSNPEYYPDSLMRDYCDRIYTALFAAEPEGSCYVISSFDHRAIRYLIEKYPERKDRFMPIFGKSVFQDVIDEAVDMGVTRVAAMLPGTSYNKVQELHEAGIKWVNLWPVRTPDEAMRAIYVGSNILCMDAPKTVKAFMDEKAPWIKIRW